MKIAFLLYDNMTALDLVGPHEVLSRLPGVQVYRVALKKGLVHSCSGLLLHADYALSDVTKADILVVPGAGNATTLRDHPEVLEWIRQIHKTTTWTTSVCTGSLILAAAGLLKKIKATTHWAVLDRLSAWGAEPVSSRVVEEGKIMTAAGVSAGIDMALTLCIRVAGVEVAQSMQLAIEYDPQPPFDVGSIEKASKQILEPLRERMISRFEEVK